MATRSLTCLANRYVPFQSQRLTCYLMVAADASPGSGEGSNVKVLVVEDTPEFRQLIVEPLRREGFDVHIAEDGVKAIEHARSLSPDVIVLDLGLPGLDGVEVCRRIRGFSDAWIIMLTSRDEEVDKVMGLSAGADDYVTKPFSSRELVARIRAVMRRTEASSARATTRHVGTMIIDTAAREVTVEGERIDLTKLEFDLLDTLSAEPGVVFSRERLLDRVWGRDWGGDSHVVDVHISNLRRKLGDDPGSPRYVRTVRGVGFRLGRG